MRNGARVRWCGAWRRMLAALALGFALPLAGLAASAPPPADAPTHIRVVSNHNYPPFFFLDGDGRPQGYEAEVWRLFEQRTGIRVELVLSDWGAAMQAMTGGRADVIDMLYRTRDKYPWLEMQTIYPFTEDGVGRAVADAMAMKTVKSTIVPWPELVE